MTNSQSSQTASLERPFAKIENWSLKICYWQLGNGFSGERGTEDPAAGARAAAAGWQKTGKPALGPIHVRNKPLPAKIVFTILDLVFARPEPKFEPPQPFVAQGGRATCRRRSPAPRIGGCLPHHQIVRAQLLKSAVGSAKFIEGLPALIQKNRGRHRLVVIPGGG